MLRIVFNSFFFLSFVFVQGLQAVRTRAVLSEIHEKNSDTVFQKKIWDFLKSTAYPTWAL